MNTKPNLLVTLELNEKINIFEPTSLKTKNSFTEPSKALAPLSSRVLHLENINIFNSKKSDQCEFTNFLNIKNKTNCDHVLHKLFQDLLDSEFKQLNYELDENMNYISDKSKNKLREILGLYTNCTQLDFSGIAKAKIKDLFNNSTGFRIYVTIEDYIYKIILLDPLHFAMPSEKQSKKGFTYKDNKGNNLCMYKHLIQKNSSLNQIYKKIKNDLESTS